MKKTRIFATRKMLLLIIIFQFVIIISGFAQPFITTWKTDNLGTSNNTSITIPTTGSGYNYDVDWDNDGVFDEFGITGDMTHDFGVAGTYTIAIQGAFPRIYFNNIGDKLKIISIDQWGSNVWTSMENAFKGCYNLSEQAVDVPNLSLVTNTAYMFYAIGAFNQDIGSWDISNVQDMTEMLGYSGLNVQNYDNTLIGWESQGITHKTLGANNLNYCIADSVRNRLINNYNWTINGDSYDCSSVNVNNQLSVQNFEISPNPTQGQLNIKAVFDTPLNKVQIKVMNTIGQVVEQINLGNNKNSIQQQVDLTSLASGIYSIVLQSNEKVVVKMVVIN